MRWRSPGSFIVGALVLSLTGCPDSPTDDPDTGRRDTGACLAVDVGPSAPDGDEPADADASDASDASDDVSADAGSDGDAPDGDVPDAPVDADVGDAPSFDTLPREFDAGPPVARAQIDQIINLSCTFTSCHGRSSGVGGLTLYKTGVGDWYPNLVGVPSEENPSMPYVDPGNPAGSWLVHKIVGDQCIYTAKCKGRDCGDQMPAANEPLDDSDIQTILDWIRQGAKPK